MQPTKTQLERAMPKFDASNVPHCHHSCPHHANSPPRCLISFQPHYPVLCYPLIQHMLSRSNENKLT